MAPEGLDVSHTKLHPFFVPGSSTKPEKPEPSEHDQFYAINEPDLQVTTARSRKKGYESQHPSSDIEAPTSEPGEDGRVSKRQKTGGNTVQGSGKKRGRPRKKNAVSTVDIANHFPQAGSAPPPAFANSVPQPHSPAPALTEQPNQPITQGPTQAINSKEPLDSFLVSNMDVEMAQPKPTKVLKFNPKTGTIGSPPKPKPVPAEITKSSKSSKSQSKPSRIVTIKYGHDPASREQIGVSIEQILASPPKALESRKTPPKSRAKVSKLEQGKSKPKDTHPLFLGKSKGAPKVDTPAVAAKPPRTTIFTSTPCSPKKQRSAPVAGKFPQFGIKSTGLKVPGACHPAWPAQGMTHVRGLSDAEQQLQAEKRGDVSYRKSKGQKTNIFRGESVVDQLAKSLDALDITKSIRDATDDYVPPPPEIRLPKKHFESGRKLRQRIRSELRTCLPISTSVNDESDDEVLTASKRKPHPAIARLYSLLETNLSAYDRSQCEELPWAQKYAPVCADEVLQSGEEGVLLKEWLQTLEVQSVITGVANTDQKSSRPGSATKKKRKRNKLDGFVVSSGDETEFFSAVSDDEDDWLPARSHDSKKTVVRRDVAKDMSRLTNAVVLSGPHGCGKTAAVYAVAKELGFEVFEINASSRRSGKDVMEKVGDMTQNHLVQHHQGGKGDGVSTVDDDTSKGIKSGKQGTMTSFFKPKAAPQPEPQPQLNTQEQPVEAVKLVKSKAQIQKQSLILLEEVDVLYEEDKQFWVTIVNLIAQSKRPFIMTCNDETMVPFHNFLLYGILRFTPPPEDLAVDTLLLIAANEGHALQRAAVSALYESKGNDLRASLMELNYWCQLGVGDRRGGFDWFYPRWPKGCDKDENGDVVRVVSEGTYLEGMGWVSRDPAVSAVPSAVEEELMTQCWHGLGMDLGNWHESLDMISWSKNVQTSSAKDRAAALDVFCEFSDAMSVADLCSGGNFGLRFKEPLDPTQPGISTKTRDDFVLGRRLLEAPPLMTYTCTATAIASSLKSAARQLLRAAPLQADSTAEMGSIQEGSAIRQMRQSFVKPAQDAVITRYDMSLAFDPIAASEKAAAAISNSLEPSVFDRTMRLITLDVAPYVRGIVIYDHRLMQERVQRSGLLSEGGRPGKRMRSTRSAYSALEGAARGSVRRESYFAADISAPLVMRTGGESWQAAVDEEMSIMGEIPSPAAASDIAPETMGLTLNAE
ncbi:ATPase family AAA domain-containing protein 5 [Colletotrichum chlorophyti]|uniref:ATPase family AAA domain-containing protein 5 n=1 Tax=Colletotrichum chlorophyti TaxID=708187 RepID=A0A1Q8RS44_9PEZI|nr:ATPase family AAA domain-containing protein 5 [Colletotrichum chlorophyti]